MCPRLAPRSSLTFHRLLRPHAPPPERDPLVPPQWMPITAPRQVARGPRPARRRRGEMRTEVRAAYFPSSKRHLLAAVGIFLRIFPESENDGDPLISLKLSGNSYMGQVGPHPHHYPLSTPGRCRGERLSSFALPCLGCSGVTVVTGGLSECNPFRLPGSIVRVRAKIST